MLYIKMINYYKIVKIYWLDMKSNIYLTVQIFKLFYIL